jgi:hypothetical protein
MENLNLIFRGLITPGSYNEKNKTFDAVFTTEAPVVRSAYNLSLDQQRKEDSDIFNEVLLCNAKAMRMDRARTGLPLLDNHPWDANSTQVLGKCTNFRFEKNQLVGTVTLGARADDALIADIKNGILTTFSVGYRVYNYTPDKKNVVGETPTYFADDWEPFEISLAPIPADINAQIRSLIMDKTKTPGAVAGDQTQIQNPAPTPDAARSTEPAASPTPAPQVENTSAVTAEFRKSLVDEGKKESIDRFNEILDSTRAAKLDDAKAIEYFKSDSTIAEIRKSIIAEFVKADPQINGLQVGKEAIEKKSDAMQEALLSRAFPGDKKFVDDPKNEYRGLALYEMARELFAERGINARLKTKSELADMVFSHRTMGTDDFPLLLENAANKVLRGDYMYSPEYWSMIARQTSFNDFKDKSFYQLGSENGMKEMKEGAELKYGSLVEAKQTAKLKKYAEALLFTREMFINDDLSALSSIPQKFVLDWNTIQGDIIWGFITSNVVMEDGKALFSTQHSNLASTAAVISEESMAAALIALKRQKGLDGKRVIRIVPQYLIVSPEYEIAARKLLTTVSPTQASQVNVFSGMGLTIIVEPRLTGKAWYLAANPNAVDGIYYGYLNGAAGLRTYREDNFKLDAIEFAVRGEFGANVIDYRGWYKNAGE